METQGSFPEVLEGLLPNTGPRFDASRASAPQRACLSEISNSHGIPDTTLFFYDFPYGHAFAGSPYPQQIRAGRQGFGGQREVTVGIALADPLAGDVVQLIPLNGYVRLHAYLLAERVGEHRPFA